MSYDDSEARDSSGKWTAGGGSGGGAAAEGRSRLDAINSYAAEQSAGNRNAEIWAAAAPEPHVATYPGWTSSGENFMVDDSGNRVEGEPNGPKNLTPAEEDSVKSYTAGGYAVNEQLRGVYDVTPKGEELVANVDSAIARAEPTAEPTTLFRGIGEGKNLRGDVAPDFGQLQPGDTFTDQGFVSASTSESFADNWGDGREHEGQLLEIRAPAGSQGLSVNPATGAFTHEEEVILPRGSNFVVDEQLPDRTVVHYTPST